MAAINTIEAVATLALALGAVPSLVGQQPDAPLLTLKDALAIAASSNPANASSQLSIGIAKDSFEDAKTHRYPILSITSLGLIPFSRQSFNIPVGALGTYPGIGPIPSASNTLGSSGYFTSITHASASQPLTQLYAIHLSVASAKVGILLAEQSYRLQEQSTAEQVRQAYYQLPAAQFQIEALQVALESEKELLTETDHKLEQKTVLLSSELSVKAQLNEYQYELASAQDALQLKKESLNQLLNRPLDTTFTVEETPPDTPEELDQPTARALALAQRPEIMQAKLQVTQADYQIRVEKAAYIPTVSVEVHDLVSSGSNLLPLNSAGAGFSFSWQPYDWGDKRDKLKELRGQKAQDVIQQGGTTLKVLLNVDQSFLSLREARQLLGVRRSAREAAVEQLRETTSQYKQQAALLSSLEQQQAALKNADSQYAQALSQFWSAKAALRLAIGEDQ